METYREFGRGQPSGWPDKSGYKMKASKTVRSIVVAALVVLAAAGLRADIVEQVLVKVNGEIFTKTDLETRQIAALRQMGQQADQKTNLSDTQLRKMLDDVTPQLMVNIIDEILLVQRGHELGYTMSNERFQSIVDSIVRSSIRSHSNRNAWLPLRGLRERNKLRMRRSRFMGAPQEAMG